MDDLKRKDTRDKEIGDRREHSGTEKGWTRVLRVN